MADLHKGQNQILVELVNSSLSKKKQTITHMKIIGFISQRCGRFKKPIYLQLISTLKIHAEK